MKYDNRTCGACGMFVSNNVMSSNEIWQKSMYNFKRVTISNNIVVNHIECIIILPESVKKSGKTLITYCILCYSNNMCIGPIHLLAIMCFFNNFFTPRCICECMIFLWAYDA